MISISAAQKQAPRTVGTTMLTVSPSLPTLVFPYSYLWHMTSDTYDYQHLHIQKWLHNWVGVQWSRQHNKSREIWNISGHDTTVQP